MRRALMCFKQAVGVVPESPEGATARERVAVFEDLK
jgi:hypothetical protein